MQAQINGFLPFPKGFATKTIHAAQDPDNWQSAPVVCPIVTASLFKQPEANFKNGFYYGRCGNPTRECLQQVMASLDNAKYGTVYPSGLGAINTLVGLLKSGDHIVCIDGVYGGTDRLLRDIVTKFGMEITFIDCTDPANVHKAIKSNTKMIFVETPTNPMLTLVDIGAISKIAKKHDIIFVVDNTFLTPYLQRPLELGADIAVYSITKYINGHSDVIMGCLTTNDEKLNKKLTFLQTYMGAIPGPFDCYQVIRGLKTLALRMQTHLTNGLIVAKFLQKHSKIEKVIHPMFSCHPQHELAKATTCGFSGTFPFYIKGDLKASEKLVKSLKMIVLAGSLGEFHSIIEIPLTMSHEPVPKAHLKIIGITENLIRLHVGLEDVEDIIADLDQALAQI